jgi:aspartyl-tRNA(Asn)/glutamyl-tRNA(Gln) amidotransferase subunit A
MPTLAGSSATAHEPRTADAGAVSRLRAAGAIIIGKTTTHEFASGQGDPGTRNPRHPGHHPGGSSVGSAVAVAVGSVGATLGTDTTGSIRNPAAVNGVVGFKPRNDAVPATGILHFSRTLDTIGPIGTSVSDCLVMFEALTGCVARRWPTRPPVLVVAPVPEGATAAFRAVFAEALATLADAGATLVPHAPLAYDSASAAALVISLVEVVQEHRELLRTRGERLGAGTRQLLASGSLLGPDDEALARRTQARLRTTLTDLRATTGADAVIGLTLPHPPPLRNDADTMLTASAGQGSLSAGIQQLAIANVTGAPAITLPADLADGHPVGIHLLGLSSDLGLLRAAEFVEQALRDGDEHPGRWRG